MKRKEQMKMSILIASIFIILFSVTYALISVVVIGNKKQVISAGELSLEFTEENQIQLEDAFPMYDEVGMIQNPFVFRLKNNSNRAVLYKILLEDKTTEEENKLDKSIIKYGLQKNSEQKIDRLSNLEENLDEGIIKKGEIIEYKLRLWIDSTVEDNDLFSGKTLRYQIHAEVNQNPNPYIEYELTGSKINQDNQLSIEANSKETISVTLKSNSEIETKYQLYYQSEDKNDLSVQYLETTKDLPYGNIEAEGIKELELVIKNNSNNKKIVRLGVKGSDVQNSGAPSLDESEYPIQEIIKQKDLLEYKITSNQLDENNQILIKANTTAELELTITSLNDIDTVYQLYHNQTAGNVKVRYVTNTTESLPYGSIAAHDAKKIKLIIHNDSYIRSIIFGVKGEMSDKKVEDIVLASNEVKIFEGYSYPTLASVVKQGDYVAYVGNNGCKKDGTSITGEGNAENGNSCLGYNANANVNGTSDSNGQYGYCYESDKKYNFSGWRVAYTQNNRAFLISAASPECISETLITAGNTSYINTANEKARKYCNSKFVDGNCSNNADSWAINDVDFYKITSVINNGSGRHLTNYYGTPHCYQVSSAACGLNNALINIGGRYSFAAAYNATNKYGIHFGVASNSINHYTSENAYSHGLRPIIRLSASVYVTGGTGAEHNPYKIAN